MHIEFPKIKVLAENSHQPFWSVMIPTYNGTKYLEETLKCVLVQDEGVDEMQIHVIDDCSSKDDPRELVERVGKGRVTFSQNFNNLGLVGNWNACIDQARGKWVHILHQDDIVMPSFYNNFRRILQTNSDVGAAFCRHVFMDEDSNWTYISGLENKNSDILKDWIKRIAVSQLIQFPSIVVKREVYEKLGGFCAKAHFASDWEMWKRIATYYPIWYEPKVLGTGRDISDIREAINISEYYLPSDLAEDLSRKARQFHALAALDASYRMIHKRNWKGAKSTIEEALKCSHSPKVLRRLFSLFKSATKQYIYQNLLHSNH
jgi:glycosyltransferase involved in cell wall biosynthesis